MKTVTVKVLSTEKDCEGFPPTRLREFIEWAHSLEDQIPGEYWDSTLVEFGSRHGYDEDTETTLEVTYVRPETETERQIREERDRREEEARQRFNERREHQEYLRLKKKFETTSTHP